MKVVTRFAPSPTGDLHLGSARTALFNYLFSRRNNGKFLLRIEDTDRERSTQKSLENILEGLNWLGLKHDDDIVYQSLRTEKYLEVAKKLVNLDKAYYCYTSKEEIENLREESKQNKETFIFQSPYRDSKISPRADQKPVIRLKTPKTGKIILEDLVQGRVEIDNSNIEDTILVRSDGTPTYMLSVVVDDIEMGITHIIRGVDHLTNCFRQILIYKALDARLPIFSHIALIHGEDGAKMSKRHGATSLLEYKKLGYLPETMLNYLLRLGWSHGDDEIISLENAISWFDLEHIGKSPSRFDQTKLSNLNFYYINQKSDHELLEIIRNNIEKDIDEESFTCIKQALKSIKERSKTLLDLIDLASLYFIGFKVELQDIHNIPIDQNVIKDLIAQLQGLYILNQEAVKSLMQDMVSKHNIKLSSLMGQIRILMTGQQNSPSIFEMISIVGKNEAIRRLTQIDEYTSRT
jgi:glutamyl-tRNA synthetase